MTNCKVLSFKEIHETNCFRTACESCVNLNYRKNLELEYENDKLQQAKTDAMYWKERAKQDSADELVDLYSKFQKGLKDRNNEMFVNPEMKTGDESLKTSFNYEVRLPSSTSSTPRGPALRLDDLTSTASVSNTARVNDVLNSAESLIRRVEAPSGPRGLNISADVLANSRAGLRPTTTRPASQAPASNTSTRVQLINELTNALSNRSRARRSSNASYINQLPPLSTGSLTPPGGNSPQQLSPESSDIRNPNQVRAQQERRFREKVIRNMPARQNTNQPSRVDEPAAGSGLKKKAKKKSKTTKARSKANILM